EGWISSDRNRVTAIGAESRHTALGERDAATLARRERRPPCLHGGRRRIGSACCHGVHSTGGGRPARAVLLLSWSCFSPVHLARDYPRRLPGRFRTRRLQSRRRWVADRSPRTPRHPVVSCVKTKSAPATNQQISTAKSGPAARLLGTAGVMTGRHKWVALRWCAVSAL